MYSAADTALHELGQLFVRNFGRRYSCDHESVCHIRITNLNLPRLYHSRTARRDRSDDNEEDERRNSARRTFFPSDHDGKPRCRSAHGSGFSPDLRRGSTSAQCSASSSSFQTTSGGAFTSMSLTADMADVFGSYRSGQITWSYIGQRSFLNRSWKMRGPQLLSRACTS
jgi:hypothetical protein